MKIKELRKLTGMTQKGFAEYFGIPQRTVEDWETERREPPAYVPDLIEYKLRGEGLVDKGKAKLEKIAKLNAVMLNVPAPRVEVSEPSFFKTPTTRAAIVGDMDDLRSVELHVNRKVMSELEADDLQAWLTISHDMRHLWQVASGKFGDEYKTSDEISHAEYNAQEEEIDAWAWATIAVVQNVGVQPDFRASLGEEMHARIMRRAEILLKKMSSD